MARILIVGCGYVGSALASDLVARGHDVFGLRRHTGGLPDGVAAITGDVVRAESLGGIPRDLDCVVYAVGAGSFDEIAYNDAYVRGPRHLVEALGRNAHALSRLVFVSSTAVYAQSDGEWVDEVSPAEATHFSGRLMREGERVFLDSGLPATVLRLGGIYGPGRTRLIEGVRDGTARLSEGSARFLNLNHRDDCVGALSHILFHDGPEDIYLGTDGHPEERNAILRWIAEHLDVAEPATESNVGKESTRGDKRCSNERLVDSGYTFQFPTFREGYAGLLSS